MEAPAYNLHLRGRSRRLRFGLLAYTFAFAAAIALVESAVSPWWRLLAFIPFQLAGVLVFQAAYGVCPARAKRGERETDTGVERVHNPEQRDQNRRRAGAVLYAATASAALATALLTILP